jgi:hypothetical protein
MWSNPDAPAGDSGIIERGLAVRTPAASGGSSTLLADEADRLKMPGLGQLQDMDDRGAFGPILIGMPGIEKRLARYPQLSSRVGFVHPFRALSPEEVRFILKEKWRHPGLLLQRRGLIRCRCLAAAVSSSRRFSPWH